MFYRSKYIIIDVGMNVVPVIFSEIQIHREIAGQLGANKKDVLGAGFCQIRDNKYVCYGESISLGVMSRGEEDSKFLNKYLGVTED